MGTSASLNILVVSDLHAHGEDPNGSKSPSYYSINSLYGDGHHNPLADIPSLVKSRSTDWVLTPGDLGDKAEPVAQKTAWEALHGIKVSVGASQLFGTTGNHDVDSRRVFPDYDPKSALQTLKPLFPTSHPRFVPDDGANSDRYWSKNFVVMPFPAFDCTLLILNSSAFHGYASDAEKPPNEHLCGKVSPLTLEAIRTELQSHPTRLNILLVHHHLSRHPWIEDANSYMVGGDKLVEALKETGRQWLVVHGHQHVPRLSYADGTPLAPVVLSAGSVAAKTYPVQGVHPRNQIHHICVDVSAMDASGAELLGTVTSWTWAVGIGWRPASADGGLPSVCGFGYRPVALELRDRLVAQTKASPNGVQRWSEIVAKEPKLKYITHEDLRQVLRMVETAGVTVDWDRNDAPRQLEWPQ